MNFRHVDCYHYVCSGYSPDSPVGESIAPSKRLPKAAQTLWKEWDLYVCDRAIVATQDGRIVAFFRYYVHRPGITAAGTWVDPKYRGKGLAIRLWRMALQQTWIKKVYVTTVSRGGGKLVDALEKRFPRVKFHREW